MKTPIRTTQIMLLVIVGLGVLFWGANFWVKYKIKSLLDQQVEQGHLFYDSFEVNIFTNRAGLKNIHWIQQKSDLVHDIYSAAELTASGFNFIKYLNANKIHFNHLLISNAEIELVKIVRDTLQIDNQEASTATKTMDLSFGVLELHQTKIHQVDQNSKDTLFSAQIPSFQMEEVQLDRKTIHQPIPIRYSDYEVVAHTVFYRLSDLFNLSIGRLNSRDSLTVLENLEIKSPYEKLEFSSHIPFEKAWLDLMIPKVELTHFGMDHARDSLEFSAESIRLMNAQLDIYKDNRLPDYPNFKPLYSRLIRELPIKISVDSTHIIDTDIKFQLQTKEEPPPGMIYFEKINAHIAHLNNTGSYPPTSVLAQTQFMGDAKFEMTWSFNSRSPNDEFEISGILYRLKDEDINHFVTPALNIATEGAINKLAFNYNGNNHIARGDMYVDYDALRIHLLKKDGTSRHRWISGILNFILRNKLDGAVEEKNLTVERIQTKSFWHYLWAMVREGTLETIK